MLDDQLDECEVWRKKQLQDPTPPSMPKSTKTPIATTSSFSLSSSSSASTRASPTAPFRVVVVGGGVTGLIASHCLQKAGIDHVVLERRDEVAPAEGASIAMYPHGARILHQIDCLQAIESACVPGDRWFVRGPDGRKIMQNGFFRHLEAKYVPLSFSLSFSLSLPLSG